MPIEVIALTLLGLSVSLSSRAQGVPSNAILDRAGVPILDRSGTIITGR